MGVLYSKFLVLIYVWSNVDAVIVVVFFSSAQPPYQAEKSGANLNS